MFEDLEDNLEMNLEDVKVPEEWKNNDGFLYSMLINEPKYFNTQP